MGIAWRRKQTRHCLCRETTVMPSTHFVRLACLLAASFTVPAHAGCLGYPSQGGPQTVSFGSVTVPVDLPAGALLAEKSTVGWTSSKFKCFKPTRTASMGIFATPSTRGEGIFATNVPGVGVRVYFDNGQHGERLVPDREHIPWIFDTPLVNAHFRVQLIKTDAVDTGGALTSGTLARGGYDDRAQAWVDLTDTRIEPERPTCAFATRSLTFPLGRVDGRDLLVAGSSSWVSQSLVSTGCRNATQILMSFTALADEHDASLFKVTGATPAAGVAVELRSDDPDTQVLPNNTSPLILPAVREGRSYGFRARYRLVGQTVTPGEANASIVVNVSYR
jgi:type 1 fimbria pilin